MNPNFHRALSGLFLFAFLTAFDASAQTPAPAPPPSQEELLRQLTCQPGQECEAPQPGANRKRGFNAASGGAQKRSFSFQPGTAEGRAEIEQKVVAGKLPSADVEVTFDFNSDVVGPVARLALASLGAVLNNPKLAGSRFVLVGHTDAKGGDAFNQALSERRAAAVKRHLVEAFAIAPGRLDTYGRGRTVLKNPAAPLAAENRRVQVVNQSGVVGEAK